MFTLTGSLKTHPMNFYDRFLYQKWFRISDLSRKFRDSEDSLHDTARTLSLKQKMTQKRNLQPKKVDFPVFRTKLCQRNQNDFFLLLLFVHFCWPSVTLSPSAACWMIWNVTFLVNFVGSVMAHDSVGTVQKFAFWSSSFALFLLHVVVLH